ncbi:Uma2 family endonuclease [Methylicorpusculum sp.]|uniref:Uma2 family endonuclease n=1 Tax=Methylicorpusculum sp. TaxID=2713644 RepID=UPI00271DC606|nr:Uma2 family endonuclease [Methylicorpusculum sp.]MDO8845693.1 Uma2 family endonuclease [Methylicorpusculum sp.]
MSTPSAEDLPHYTYEDYVQWEGRWELIYGLAHAMSPSPSIAHQAISQHIASQLERGLENCEECRALLPVDWKIDEETTVQPDNLVFCGELEKSAYLSKAPKLIFEILSKATAHKDRTTKFKLYEREGVKYYVIVDPLDSIAKIYHLQEGRYIKILDASKESIEFDLGKCRIHFDFAKIWL